MKSQSIKVIWTGWEIANELEVTTWDEAREVLSRIGTSPAPPPLVEFYDPESRRAIGVGIGRDISVVTYQDSLDPPYYTSLGRDTGRAHEWFCCGKEGTEFAGYNLIPYRDALVALEQFFARPSRPDNLE